MGGLKPEHPVIVSFVGTTGFDNPHAYADSGVRYDWRFVKGLAVQVFVKPGIDARDALERIFDEVDLVQAYPMLVDVERKQVAAVVENRPLSLWHVKAGGSMWKDFFA